MRKVLGVIGAILILLSSGAHSFLGWKALSAQLVAAGAPKNLITGLGIGWHFGGACMLTFASILLWIFLRGMPTLPAFFIAIFYLAFGAFALVVSNFDPFFAVFIVPGVLLLIAAWPR